MSSNGYFLLRSFGKATEDKQEDRANPDPFGYFLLRSFGKATDDKLEHRANPDPSRMAQS